MAEFLFLGVCLLVGRWLWRLGPPVFEASGAADARGSFEAEPRLLHGGLVALTWTPLCVCALVWGFALAAHRLTGEWPRMWQLDFSGGEIRNLPSNLDASAWRMIGFAVAAGLALSVGIFLGWPGLAWALRRSGFELAWSAHARIAAGLVAFVLTGLSEPGRRTLAWLID